MPTIVDLGQKVKAKYPAYSNMSDWEVGQKVKAKYPSQYGDFADAPNPASTTLTTTGDQQKPNLFNKIDEAINKPAFDLSQDNPLTTGPVKTAFKSAANTAKDALANVWGFVKSPFITAKNVAYDIPKAVFGSQDMGQSAGTVGGKPAPLPFAARGMFHNLVSDPKNLLDPLAKTVLPPAAQKLGGVDTGTFKPEPTQALQSLAEKPVSNILPVVLTATGIAEGKGMGTGGLTTGSKMIDTAVEKTGQAPINAVKSTGKFVADTAGAVADRYEGITKSTPEQLVTKAQTAVREGMQKGVKPTIIGKQSMTNQTKFYDNAQSAVKTIAENRSKIQIVNPETGEVTNKPVNNAEFAQALEQSKKLVYDQYHDLAVRAGNTGLELSSKPIVGKLYKTAFTDIKFDANGLVDREASTPNVKYSPATRKYALQVIDEIKELEGQGPEVWEARIKDLNSSAAGYYEGRTAKATAQLDASVAASLREILDNGIESALNEPGYQDLKNQYGALKALEKDVNKRAIVTARQNAKNLPTTLTDIWSGAELASSLFGNPSGIIKAVAAKGLSKYTSWLNNPDNYIQKMFDAAYEAYPEKGAAVNGSVVSGGGGGGVSGPPAPRPFPNLPKINVGLSIEDVSGRSAQDWQAGDTFKRLQQQKNKLLDQGYSENSPQVKNIIKSMDKLSKKDEGAIPSTKKILPSTEKYKTAEDFINSHQHIERYGKNETEAGKSGRSGKSIFYSEKGMVDPEDFGSYKTESYLDKNAKIFKGPSSVDYAIKNGLMEKPFPLVKEITGLNTLAEVDEAYAYGVPKKFTFQGKELEPSVEFRKDPNRFYTVFQQIVADDLESKGYQGARWTSEDELIPLQYQIWDRSIIKNKEQLTNEWNLNNKTYYHGTSAEDAASILKNGFNPKLSIRGKNTESPYALFASEDLNEASYYGNTFLEFKPKESIKILSSADPHWTETMGRSRSVTESAQWADKLRKEGYDLIDDGDEVTILNPKKFNITKSKKTQ